jgi:uncharacterized coiled-coil DUF342 family protein
VELMRSRKISLEESIEALARETGASPSFVDKVRALFLGRGVDLEDSAEPYADALAEAFRRHARMRTRLDEARDTLVRLHANIAELGSAFSSQLERLRAIREAPERSGAARRRAEASGRTITIEALHLSPGDTDKNEVPGPSEIQ